MESKPMNLVGKIEIQRLREAFRHEALDFTTWMAENIDALSDRVGFSLTVTQRESSVGDFQVDLLCQDDQDRRVIVENQLERTDHDHLGKVLTYLVNLEAQVAIWVTAETRPEHQRVIDWLNENTGEDIEFYLVKVEAIRIGESPFAPLFTIVAAPDARLKNLGAGKIRLTTKELAERERLRIEFWQSILQKSSSRTRLLNGRKPTKDHWLSIGAGKSGVQLNLNILKNRAVVEIYIDVGNKDQNKAIFDQLMLEKAEIEMEFGEPLEWKPLDAKRACRILYPIETGSLRARDTWDELQDEMIDAMIRLDATFRRRLQSIGL